jgi:hypothetical protein
MSNTDAKHGGNETIRKNRPRVQMGYEMVAESEAFERRGRGRIRNPQSAIRNPQSAVRNPQSPIANRQSTISSRHSPIVNRQSTTLATPP